jgi:hypothetical protein
MTPEEERVSYQQSIESIERATGTRPLGFNAFWLRGTPHTLEILQSLGFIYHIDDVSREEPFLINVGDNPFAVVPYTLHMNDIVDYETRYFSTAMYADDLKAEFDALYAEAGTRRRMMSVSAHDRIAGRPSRAMVLEQFIIYAQSHPGVAFKRKDEIARFALESPRRCAKAFNSGDTSLVFDRVDQMAPFQGASPKCIPRHLQTTSRRKGPSLDSKRQLRAGDVLHRKDQDDYAVPQ